MLRLWEWINEIERETRLHNTQKPEYEHLPSFVFEFSVRLDRSVERLRWFFAKKRKIKAKQKKKQNAIQNNTKRKEKKLKKIKFV